MKRLVEKRSEVGDKRLVDGGDGTIVPVNGVGSQAIQQSNNTSNTNNLLLLPRVNQLPKREVFNTVLAGVAKAFADMNVKDISETDRDYLVNELTDNIIRYYASIRLPEITLAFWMGVRGNLGEFFGLSVVTFERFISQYLISAQRVQAVKELPQPLQRLVPDKQTQFGTAKGNAMRALQMRRERKDTSVIAPVVYNFLDGIGLINFTAAEKYDMLADATRELISELKYKLTLTPGDRRNAIKADLTAFKEAITQMEPLSNERYTLVKQRAKKLALDAFLNNVLMAGTDLGAMIEAKRQVFIDKQ